MQSSIWYSDLQITTNIAHTSQRWGEDYQIKYFICFELNGIILFFSLFTLFTLITVCDLYIMKWELVRFVSWCTFINFNFYNFYFYAIINICVKIMSRLSTCVKVNLLHLIRNGEVNNLLRNNTIKFISQSRVIELQHYNV